MKRLLVPLIPLVLALLALSAPAAVKPNGYLVFEIQRHCFPKGEHDESNVKRKFKIPLTTKFFAGFRSSPSKNSSGTGFYCQGGDLKSNDGTTRFMWWLRKKIDGRWAIDMWGRGLEVFNKSKQSSWNPTVTQSVTVKAIEDIDMAYMISYLSDNEGVNVTFRAHFVKGEDIGLEGEVPTATVLDFDQSLLQSGDDLTQSPVVISCGFQEG